jgi:hypothetical protein
MDSGILPDAGTTDAGAMDAGVPDEDAGFGMADGGAQACASCVATRLEWGYSGGLVAYTRRQSVDPCNVFTLQQTDYFVDAGNPSCTNEIPCVASGVYGMDSLLNALGHSDVIAAFAAAPVLFGVDQRPVDGPLFEADLGGSVIQVGSDCGGSVGCTAIPDGVRALRTLLLDLGTQRMAVEDCPTAFPGG